MPRDRHQRGWVEETGKRLRKFKGHYYVYVKGTEGQETRHHRAVILGLKSRMTKWQAEEKLAEVIRRAEANPGLALPDSRQTLEWFWTTRYLPMKEARWRPATRSVVTSIMQRHVIPQLGARRLCDLSRFDLQMHLNNVGPKYSGSTIRKVRTWVKAFLGEAVDQGFLEKNPARKLDLPNTRESSKRFLNLPEIGGLLSATAGKDHLIVRLFIECGLRPGELFAARWGSLSEGQLVIREAVAKAIKGRAVGKTKTPESKKAIALPTAFVASLNDWRRACGSPADEAFIFASRRGTPLSSANYLKRFLKPLGKTLGIPGLNYQVFRRTFSTHFQRHATLKETQTQMRHTDAATTLGIYTQPIPESLAAAVEAFHREIDGLLNTNEHKFEM